MVYCVFYLRQWTLFSSRKLHFKNGSKLKKSGEKERNENNYFEENGRFVEKKSRSRCDGDKRKAHDIMEKRCKEEKNERFFFCERKLQKMQKKS